MEVFLNIFFYNKFIKSYGSFKQKNLSAMPGHDIN